MKKGLFFKLGLVLAVLVALVAAGAIVAVKSINTDQLKDLLTSQVKKSTGRVLAIDGPVEIKIGLVPRVVVNDVRLSNPSGSLRPDMIQLKRLEVEVALQPLLKRQVVVNRLILSSPDILIETDPQGPGNLDFTAADKTLPPQEEKDTAATEKNEAASSLSVAINEFKIENGVFVLYDRATKKMEQVTIESLSLQRNAKNLNLVNLQLLTTVRGNKINLKGSLGGIDAITSGAPWPLQLKAEIGGLTLHADGTVADIKAFHGVNIKLSARGDELAEVLRMAGDQVTKVPDSIGPFTVAAILNDTGKQFSLNKVDLTLGKKSLVEVQVQGNVHNLSSNITPDLHLQIESTDPSKLAPLAGSEIPIKGPFRLTGKVKGSGNKWNISELDLTANKSDIKGTLQVQLGKRPYISGQLASSTIDLADLTGTTASNTGKSSGNTSSKPQRDGRIFTDQPLPFSALKSADADVKLQVAKLLLETKQLNGVQVTVGLKNGVLSVDPFRFGLAGGTFDGNMRLDGSAKTPNVAVSISGKGFELGKLQDKSPLSGGKSDMKVDLKGRGSSVRAIMASMTGETVISVGQGRLANKAINWAAGDLLFQVLGSLNPLSKSEDYTNMSCAAVRFLVRDGIATADKGIALRTEKVDVVGSGTVNLKNERLDLGIKPQARGGVGLSLSTPLAGLVRVNGTLAKPSMGIDTAGTLKTAASVGAGVATGGLSTLGGLLLDKVAPDSDPCLTALGKSQAAQSPSSNQGKNKRQPTKNVSPEKQLLESIFGK